MKCARLFLVGIALVVASPCLSQPVEPNASPYSRELRPGYVRTWYIYNDWNLNGILDPGDQRIAAFQNWWTPVSAHTQYNYTNGPYGPYSMYYSPGNDMSGGPMNFASETTPGAENYWLSRMKNSVEFYMTYSQFDNNDFQTFDLSGISDPNMQAIVKQRNLYRNGWAIGWVTHDLTVDPNSGMYSDDQTVAGRVKMDIFVHDGQAINGSYVDANGMTQVSRSNPQVALSNDISYDAQINGQWHPPDYTDANGQDVGYQYALNSIRFSDPNLFNQIVASMEVQERDSYALASSDVIYAGKDPNSILAALTDGNGNPYTYDDAFLSRDPNHPTWGASYVNDADDGGVIAGLSGYDYFDLNDPTQASDWGEQQVIRIDFDPSAFLAYDAEGNPTAGGIDTVLFWDFGYDPNASQVNPIPIFLSLMDTSLFPDNRFYIAAVQVPEPGTIALLLAGSGLFLLRRRWRD